MDLAGHTVVAFLPEEIQDEASSIRPWRHSGGRAASKRFARSGVRVSAAVWRGSP